MSIFFPSPTDPRTNPKIHDAFVLLAGTCIFGGIFWIKDARIQKYVILFGLFCTYVYFYFLLKDLLYKIRYYRLKGIKCIMYFYGFLFTVLASLFLTNVYSVLKIFWLFLTL